MLGRGIYVHTTFKGEHTAYTPYIAAYMINIRMHRNIRTDKVPRSQVHTYTYEVYKCTSTTELQFREQVEVRTI